VDAAVTTFVGCFGRLCRVPWENWYKEVLWRLAVNGVRAAGACQRYFSATCPSGVVGPDAHGDCERLRQHAFWECAIAQAVRTQVQRGLGGALIPQWHAHAQSHRCAPVAGRPASCLAGCGVGCYLGNRAGYETPVVFGSYAS
jgi:DNA-binding transcriptional LysR family regulator